MATMASGVPNRFKKSYEAIKKLEKLPRYEAAFIFGSVAEGNAHNKSDLDIVVIVNRANPCENVNHPIIDSVKLDLSFIDFAKFKVRTIKQVEHEDRKPQLQKSLIVFDKTGELTKLKREISKTKPKKCPQKDFQWVQFMLYHADNKVSRVLYDDPISSLYSMHANIGEVLKYHYKLNGKWWVSSKKILADLDDWDKPLAELLKDFVRTADASKKYECWTAIIDHVSASMGGRQSIEENNCKCETCSMDLSNLLRGTAQS